MYVLFVENNVSSADGCSSQYTAVGISNDGALHTTPMIKSSQSCRQDFDAHTYEYFANKLKPISDAGTE